MTSRAERPRTVGTAGHDAQVSDEQPVPTVRDRFVAAGLSQGRVEQHRAAGRVRLDGERVDDLDRAAPVGTRIVVSEG